MTCLCNRLRNGAAITTLALAMVALVTPAAWAHTDPPGATFTGVGESLGVYSDATCTISITGQAVSECATVYLQSTVQWQGDANAAFEAGTWRITAAGAQIQDLGSVPCIGGTADDPNSGDNDGRGLCAGAVSSLTSACVPYAVTEADATAGFVAFQALYGDPNPGSPDTAYSHIGVGDLPGASASITQVVTVFTCDAPGEECLEAEVCDPTLNDGLGDCVQDPLPDSTACTDTGEECWDAGCEAGVCVQQHVPVEASTPCTDTGDVCFDAGCDGAGTCNQQHVNALDCDDQANCTVDRCDPVDGCVNEPDDTVCTGDPDDICYECVPDDPNADPDGCVFDPDNDPICVDECLLTARLMKQPRRGQPIVVEMTIVHRRNRTVTRPFRLSIMDRNGNELARKSTQDFTMEYGRTITATERINLPRDVPAGRYRLVVSMDGMTGGRKATTIRFSLR